VAQPAMYTQAQL